ncbi:MAG: IS5/IS1182 family transposase [Desulfobulbaceae bacterium]|nr:MAG: IS5/IS1182 family transposase [Desulfobulbaceae bacterium]
MHATCENLFWERLDNILDTRHELCRLAELIDWEYFEEALGKQYCPANGRPGIPIRLMVGLTYLEHAFGISDEEVVRRWVENPYWQYLCGETYFQHDLPISPSSLSRWRKRVGEEGCEAVLAATISAGLKSKAVRPASLKRITVDTTVQPKAIRYPTDARSYDRCRARLVRLAKQFGVNLRQSYVRLGPRALKQASKYAHARQFKRAKKEIKKAKTYLGRVYRDILRKILDDPDLHAEFHEELELTERMLAQQKKDKNKLYSIHAPEVECIAKGKIHKKYEFGVKVSVASTNRDNFVVGMQALAGNPFDGHTLSGALEQVSRLTKIDVERCYVDRGYRGHKIKETSVYISGQRRGVTPTIRKELKRRSAVEPIIGHMKADGKLKRNWLKGVLGDKINALLCGAGHNIRIILRKLRELLSLFLFLALFSEDGEGILSSQRI